jgi:hypothetical protein
MRQPLPSYSAGEKTKGKKMIVAEFLSIRCWIIRNRQWLVCAHWRRFCFHLCACFLHILF